MSVKKIALVGYRLNKGGAEKVMATLSNFFDSKGLDVHIIIVLDDVKYLHSGTVINLGKLKNKHNGILNKMKRFLYLKKYLKQHNFDFIIDFRFRVKPIQELIITKWLYNTKTIFTIHSSKLEIYLPNFSPLARFIYGNSFKVISITKVMEQMINRKHHLKNVQTIYNPINIIEIQKNTIEKINLNFEYIIGVGEYETNIKQFDILIKTYAESLLPKRNVHLVILGDGKNKDKLLSIIKELHIEQFVHLLGFKNNPFKYIGKAKFLVLTSKYEGFPMVLLESLACGTPIIAFDCPTGPKEIIEHKENGLLVENQNTSKLIDSMNLFIENEILYNHCKKQTLSSVDKFSIERIGIQWLDLMNNY
jgi:glycosyltransferase involved in cell wall biosynthesis